MVSWKLFREACYLGRPSFFCFLEIVRCVRRASQKKKKKKNFTHWTFKDAAKQSGRQTLCAQAGKDIQRRRRMLTLPPHDRKCLRLHLQHSSSDVGSLLGGLVSRRNNISFESSEHTQREAAGGHEHNFRIGAINNRRKPSATRRSPETHQFCASHISRLRWRTLRLKHRKIFQINLADPGSDAMD